MRRTGAGLLLSLLLVSTSAPAELPRSLQDPQTQPTSRPSVSPTDPQRLNDLISLIEGQNPPPARQTGVKELLRQNWPETPQRLAAILAGSNAAARAAIAAVLAEMPEYLHPSYVDPLISMLGLPNRTAAPAALAAYRNGGVTEKLRAFILDANNPLPARLEAVATLGLMTQRPAVAALAELLADETSPLAKPALDALEQATGMDFEDNLASARAWSLESQQLPLTDWQSRQLERLLSQARKTTAQLRGAEARLNKALRDSYLRVPEAERAACLQSYLSDSLPAVQLLGLDLVQATLADGKTPAADTIAGVRRLLMETEPAVRETAVRTVANLRDPADEERFVQMLGVERNAAVRTALVNGLGYVGSSAALWPLLKLLETPDAACESEAITALGRLAERGVLDPRGTEAVGEALLARLEATKREQAALRERLLWAISRVPDARFGPVFAAALDLAEPVAVRQAAVRGCAVLATPELIDALMPLTGDADVSLRKTAVEALAQLASSDAHVQALWTRLAPAESDDSIRETAWRGVLRVLGARSARDVELWVARLPDSGPQRARRLLELLQIEEKTLSADPKSRGELGRVRGLIAAQRAQLGQLDEALSDYVKALADLQAVKSDRLLPLTLEVLRFALSNDRYDERLVAALLPSGGSVEATALWEPLQGEIEGLLTRDAAALDRAIAILTALQTHPLSTNPELKAAVEALLRRAREQHERSDAHRPAAASGAASGSH